jgi:hypothetical protein
MAKIDPAFQAAPVLQDTYNPVEFARQAHQEKFQLQKAKYEEQQKATAEGLQKVMVNLKGWEDKEGFKELNERNQKAVETFMALSRRGLNLVNPKSTQDVMAYKAITDYVNQTKELAGQWEQQKTAYDLIQKELTEDAKLDPNDRKFKHDETQKGLEDVLNGHSIADRRGLLEKAIVPQPHIEDIDKYTKDNIGRITPPPKIQIPYKDPETGIEGFRLTTGEMSAKEKKQNEQEYRDLYSTMKPSYKASLKEIRKSDPNNDPTLTDQEYYVDRYTHKYQKESIEKGGKTGSGNFKLMNQDVKVTPAIKQTNEIPLGDRTLKNHYDFNITKTLIGVPVSNFKDAKVLMGGKWVPAGDTGGLADANLNYYDADTDSFIFTAKANAMDAGAFKGQALSIPRTSLDDGFSDLPVKDENGKTIKIKDLKPNAESKKKLVSDDFWSAPAYIPKSK